MAIARLILRSRPSPRSIYSAGVGIALLAGYLAVLDWKVVIVFLIGAILLILVAYPRWLLLLLAVTGGESLLFLTGGHQITSSMGGLNPASLQFFWVIISLLLMLLPYLARLSDILPTVRWHLLFLAFPFISFLWTPTSLYGARFFPKLLFPLLILLSVELICPGHHAKRLTKWMLLGALFVVITGPFFAFAGLNPGVWYGPEGGIHWYSGSLYMGPSLFGAYVSLMALYSLVEYHFSLRRRWLFLFVLFGANAVITLSRIVIISLLISIGIFFFAVSRTRIRYIYLVTPFILSFILFTTLEPLKKRMFFEPEGVSIVWGLNNLESLFAAINAQGRFTNWPVILEEVFWEAPLIGSGVGSVDKFLRNVYSVRLDLQHFAVPHNEYLRLLGDFGLVGLVLYLLAMGSHFWYLAAIYKKRGGGTGAKYALVALLALGFYMVFSITDNSFDYWNNLGFYVFAFIGLARANAGRHRLMSPGDGMSRIAGKVGAKVKLLRRGRTVGLEATNDSYQARLGSAARLRETEVGVVVVGWVEASGGA